MKVHHVAYAVADLERASDKFEKLGYSALGDIVCDDHRNIRILFMSEPITDTLIELVEPVGDNNDVKGVLDKAKGSSTLYHICYQCDGSIDETLSRLRQEGFLVVRAPLEAPAIDGRKVAFMFSKQTGLIEIVE